MDMSSMTATATDAMSMTATAAMGTSTASASSMSMGGNCKISMTWNWYTIGACFISREWRITSSGMFAGSCIGVILLVMSLEFLRRCQREYDAFIRRQESSRLAGTVDSTVNTVASKEIPSVEDGKPTAKATPVAIVRPMAQKSTMLQRHVIRSLLHMLQFTVAYFIMLLAMYYNGYIIICIIIGAFLGALAFNWDQVVDIMNTKSQAADVTGCCG